MRNKTFIATLILFALVLGFCLKIYMNDKNSLPVKEDSNSELKQSKEYKRIISLAPSITETLFALELGNKVVGITRYCNYPAEAQKKTKVGGYYDPNYEAILSLKPDLVVLFQEHEKPREYLAFMKIDILVLNHRSLKGILDSIMKIGMVCNRKEKSKEIVQDISGRIQKIKDKTKGLSQPNVMVSIGRSMGELKNIYIAGQDGFYSEMIIIAGGRNIYTDTKVKFPLLSKEAIVRLNPDIIIDMITGLEEQDTALSDWERLKEVNAIKNKKVCILTEDYVVIPGPRFILIIEEMIKIIHSELTW